MSLGLREPAKLLPSMPLLKLMLLPLLLLLPLLAFSPCPGAAAASLTDDDLRRLATLLRNAYGEDGRGASPAASDAAYYDYAESYGEEGEEVALDDAGNRAVADFSDYGFDELSPAEEAVLRPHSANKRLLAMRMGKRFGGDSDERAMWWWPHSGLQYPQGAAAEMAAHDGGAHIKEKKQKFNMLRIG